MNAKKIFMVLVLIAFIIGLIFVFININNKAEQKVGENLDGNTNLINETDNKGNVRKSVENPKADMANILEITDNYFIEQTNDVYYNLDDYMGKTIKIEGLIYTYNDHNKDICYAVVRNTPGCCGNDGLAGLDIRYNGEYPEVNTWVEIIGVIGSDVVDSQTIPAIQVTSMTTKEEGTTFVTN